MANSKRRNHKKALIKQKAFELFLSNRYEFASVNEIVQASEIAKGTYYNYYQTKDEVYLDILKDHLKEWFDDTLLKISKEFDRKRIIPLILEGLFNNEVFLELLSKTQLTTGNNIDDTIMKEFREDFFSKVDVLSDILSMKLKMEKEETFHLFIQTYSLIVGTWQTSRRPQNLNNHSIPIENLFLNFRRDLTQMTLKIWDQAS